MVQEVIRFQEPKGWPRSYEVKRPSTGGSGGHRDFRSPRGGQGAMGLRDLIQEVREVIRILGAKGRPGGYGVRGSSTEGSGGHPDFWSPRGGQETMGFRDLVQGDQEVARGPGVREAFRRTGNQGVVRGPRWTSGHRLLRHGASEAVGRQWL